MSERPEALDDRVADLGQALSEAPDGAELHELAERYDVDPTTAEDCKRALDALRTCTEPQPLVGEADPGLPDEYELVGELGRGGMGIVYRARHRSLDREVAIKVLRPGDLVFGDMLRRFEVEAKSLAKLRHPNIVSVHDVGRTAGNVYYTMDLIDGEPLDVLVEQGSLTPSRAVKILMQVCRAIEHSHENGVIHRDLKPGNILLDSSETAFVADFGLARNVHMQAELTTTGQVLGTPAYMSPEAIRGDTQRIGEATDIYALGALLYECLTGQPPFVRKSVIDTIQAALHDSPPPPRKLNPRVPRDLELVCLKALAKEPDERYATARALLEDLERFQEGRPVLAQRPSVSRRVTRWMARNKTGIASAVCTALVVGVAARLWPVPVDAELIDRIIVSGQKQSQDKHWKAALQTFQNARALLGNAADRPEEPQQKVQFGAAHKVWRGILRCAAEIALTETESSSPADCRDAANRFANTLADKPRGIADDALTKTVAVLCRLRVLARQTDAAYRILERHAGRKHLTRRTVARLRDVLDDAEHPRWRDAGFVLARLFQEDAPRVRRVFDGSDPTAAVAAAWSHADTLPDRERGQLGAWLTSVGLCNEKDTQWQRDRGRGTRALLALARNKDLASSIRLRALDVACGREDLPWRPDGTLTRVTYFANMIERLQQQPFASGYLQRVRFAIDSIDDADNKIDVRRWLADHTGQPRTTEFRTWIRSAGDAPLRWLTGATGISAGELERGETRVFDTVVGRKRAWVHHAMTLAAQDLTATPRWASGLSEPSNLVPTWKHGPRQTGAGYALRYEILQYDMEGRVGSRTSVSSRIKPGVPETPGLGWSNGLLHRRSLKGTLRNGLRIPGVDPVHAAHEQTFTWVRYDVDLVWNGGWQVDWSASLENAPAPACTSGAMPRLELGQTGVWFVSDWIGSLGRRAGACIAAISVDTTRPANAKDKWLRFERSITKQIGAAVATIRTTDDPVARAAALAVLPDGRHDLFELLARLPYRPKAIDQLRELDRAAARLRSDDTAMAAIVAELPESHEAQRIVLARLARPLAARMIVGDSTVLDDGRTLARLAELDGLHPLGPFWWIRVLKTGDARLAKLARERLAGMELPDVLLRHVRNQPGSPTRLTEKIAAADTRIATRRGRGWTVAAIMAGVLGLLVLLCCAELWRSRKRPASRRSAWALAGAAVVSLVLTQRFGVVHMLPGYAGIACLTIAASAMWRSGLGIRSTLIAVVTLALTILAEIYGDRYLGAAATILVCATIGCLALDVGQGSLRGPAWAVALPMLAAFAIAAYAGVQVLFRGTKADSFVEVIADTGLGPLLRTCSLIGSAGFVLLAAGAAIAARRPRVASTIATLLFCTLATACHAMPPVAPSDGNTIELDFSDWKLYAVLDHAPTQYAIRKTKNGAELWAESDNTAALFTKTIRLDPHERPRLSWRWRVDRLPRKADLTRRSTDDCAARVLVMFESGQTLCYAWSKTTNAGRVFQNPHVASTRVFVLERGAHNSGYWFEVDRDVIADFRRAFSGEPPAIVGIGVMTDTDQTKGRAQAGFAGFAFSRSEDRKPSGFHRLPFVSPPFDSRN